MTFNTIETLPSRKTSLNRRQFMQSSSMAVLMASALGSVLAGSLYSPAKANTDNLASRYTEIENVWIPMPDGVRLAARIWLPIGADKKPVPAIWNYCPYFKRSFTRLGDDMRFPYYAANGYACIRVDIRGSGDSDGNPMDEYVKQEQDDALEVIKWIASQPWCTGSVGMEGLSWSGFSSLQVAARRPPALKAIITHCSTDDRYLDDAHYKGGAILHDMFNWGSIFWTIQGQPSDPEITGQQNWRDRWLQRLNAVDFNLANWLEHQRRDDFWKHGSVSEDYNQIGCAVYAIGGWVDGYTNSVFRLMEHLKAPSKGLVGPWTHDYPHSAVPKPDIDYLSEALRWWDYWLKGIDTGIMKEPKLRIWMQDKAIYENLIDIPGYWAAEESWPSNRIKNKPYFLNGNRSLTANASADVKLELLPSQTVGLSSGNWCPSGGTSSDDMAMEAAQDQRMDDARSLSFDSEPLSEDFEILGAPELTIDLSVDKPVALIAVRLNEVLPTGLSNRVTYGILNLTHRDSHETPEALVPGKRYKIKVKLDYAAHIFNVGNRIRVAISTSYFPMILPSPKPVTLSLYAGAGHIDLPIRPKRAEDAKLHDFGKAFVPPVEAESLESTPGSRIVEWDVANKVQTIHHKGSRGKVLIKATNTAVFVSNDITYTIKDDDPTSASIEQQATWGSERGDWKPRVDSVATVNLTKDHIILMGEMNAFYGDEKVFTKKWDRKIPRDLV